MESFDYIIVGAGSAGCVLANRLTEDGRCTVLVLEWGGNDHSLFIRMPAALSIPMNTPRYNWCYETEPEPNLMYRRLQARGVRSWAAVRPLTGWSISEAIHSTSKAGSSRAPSAGRGPMSSRISVAQKRAQRAAMPTAAIADRYELHMDPAKIRSIALGSRPGDKQAIRKLSIAMAFSRKASAGWI